jgi:hypothetical protein
MQQMKNPKQPAHSILGLASLAFVACVACMLLWKLYQSLDFIAATLIFLAGLTLVALLSFLFEVQRVDGDGLGEHLADVDLDISKNQQLMRAKKAKAIQEVRS